MTHSYINSAIFSTILTLGHEQDRFTGKLIQSSLLEFMGMSHADFWKTHPKQTSRKNSKQIPGMT